MMKLQVAAGLLIGILCGTGVAAQTGSTTSTASPGAPPKVALLVHQQFLTGKVGEREQLEVETCKKFEELGIPIPWIEMESVTGSPGALFFDPANSLEEMDRAGQLLSQMYTAHPELGQLQNEIEARIASSKIVIARRRDDLGKPGDGIDLSKARYWRISVVHVHPGHESDFAEADRLRASGSSQASWVVYEVDSGTTLPTFLVIEPLRSLADAEKKPETKRSPEKGHRDFDQIAREAFLSVESNLWAIHPEMSHVSRGFASGDSDFWTPAQNRQ
jgi:proteasome lid subunit RPN8/RPN11